MVSLQDTFADAITAKDALRFYDENYATIRWWILEPGKKVVLPSSQPGVCRFCARSAPTVTFKKKAHALPESTGNKSLFTKYECDECNGFFGDGIENDFGNWSCAQRALSGVRGKENKVPTLKGQSGRTWRLEHGSDGIQVTQNESDPIAVANDVTREIGLTVSHDQYTPVAVLKSFVKMALSLLPAEELPNFRAALKWIRNPNHQVTLVKQQMFPVLYTFVPGTRPLEHSAILLRRRGDHLPVPYVTFVMTYGNEVIQAIIPSPERDTISGQRVKFPHFPTPYELVGDLKLDAPMQRDRIDLTSCSPVKEEMIYTVLRYRSKRPNS
jgi:hypothetical protein